MTNKIICLYDGDVEDVKLCFGFVEYLDGDKAAVTIASSIESFYLNKVLPAVLVDLLFHVWCLALRSPTIMIILS